MKLLEPQSKAACRSPPATMSSAASAPPTRQSLGSAKRCLGGLSLTFQGWRTAERHAPPSRMAGMRFQGRPHPHSIPAAAGGPKHRMAWRFRRKGKSLHGLHYEFVMGAWITYRKPSNKRPWPAMPGHARPRQATPPCPKFPRSHTSTRRIAGQEVTCLPADNNRHGHMLARLLTPTLPRGIGSPRTGRTCP
jgi:hypothetical protein